MRCDAPKRPPDLTDAISQLRYPSPVPCAQAIERLARAARTKHHEFWDCDVSLLDPSVLDKSKLHDARQVTDAYLLALAVAHGGRFATFDQTVPREAVRGSNAHSMVLI
jgi:predicted nucleic acid-binding protein